MQHGRRRGPGRMPEKPHNMKKAVADMIKYYREDRKVILIALFLAAGGAVLTIIGPRQISKITDLIAGGLMTGIDMAAVTKRALILAALYGCSALMTYLQHYLMAGFNQRLSKRMRRDIVEKINRLPLIMKLAAEKGMHIVLNPSPYDSALEKTDLSPVEWLLVNETEAEQISGETEPGKVWERLHAKYAGMSLLITLGGRGSTAFRIRGGRTESHHEEAVRVEAVDTTAAGDTYTGYFIAGLTEGRPLRECMKQASRAAAVAVTRNGAAESIPWSGELE